MVNPPSSPKGTVLPYGMGDRHRGQNLATTPVKKPCAGLLNHSNEQTKRWEAFSRQEAKRGTEALEATIPPVRVSHSPAFDNSSNNLDQPYKYAEMLAGFPSAVNFPLFGQAERNPARQIVALRAEPLA